MGDPERILTADGYQRLMSELEHLRTVRRHEVAERLKATRAVGTWNDPEHQSAHEEQAFVEGRIAKLERFLAEAEVVEIVPTIASATVVVGCTVTLRDEDGEEEQYTILGPMEGQQPGQIRVSYESPVGRALMGRCPGDTVDVETPMGTRRLTIVEIR